MQTSSAELLLFVVDLALACVIFLCPLFMGGRHPMGQLALMIFVLVAGISWSLRQLILRDTSWRISRIAGIWGLGLLLVGFQIAPLPANVLRSVSPATAEKLVMWTGQAESSGSSAHPEQLGEWNTISLLPSATQMGLAMLATYGLLLLVLLQRLQTLDDIERMLKCLAIAAVGMAAIGLAERIAGNCKFLWVYEHPSRNASDAAKGTFANQNHFAHFLCLGIGPLLWLLQQSLRRATAGNSSFSANHHHQESSYKSAWRIFLWAGLCCVAFAGLLSISRGGVLCMMLAAGICGGIMIWKGLLPRRAWMGLAGAVAFTGVALLIFGFESLSSRLGTVASSEFQTVGGVDSRLKIWEANRAAQQEFPWFGTGIGTHREVYPMYFETPYDREFTHCESGYLHLLTEAGWAGMALAIAAMVSLAVLLVLAMQRASTRQQFACLAAVIPGLVCSAAHSAVDFVWFIPSCMAMTVILAAIACRVGAIVRENATTAVEIKTVPKQNDPTHRFANTLAWGSVVGGLVVAGVLMVSNVSRAAAGAAGWDSYLKTSYGLSDEVQAYYSSNNPEDQHERDQELAAKMQSMMASLSNVLYHDPHDPRANLRMAALYLRHFEMVQRDSENAMPLSQIREAALASNFSSRQEMLKWIEVAVGKSNLDYLLHALRHARNAVRLCPLQGDGYLYLSELSFLAEDHPPAKSKFLAQALLVRPYAGSVLIAAGVEASMQGEIAAAQNYWKKAFHQGVEQRAQLISLLSPRIGAEDFIREFQPDVHGMRRLMSAYRQAGRTDEEKIVARACAPLLAEYAGSLRQGDSARWWRIAHGVYRINGQFEPALDCLDHALRLAPQDAGAHHERAACLLALERYDEALDEVQWCLIRSPQDKKLQELLRYAMRKKHETPSLLQGATRGTKQR